MIRNLSIKSNRCVKVAHKLLIKRESREVMVSGVRRGTSLPDLITYLGTRVISVRRRVIKGM